MSGRVGGAPLDYAARKPPAYVQSPPDQAMPQEATVTAPEMPADGLAVAAATGDRLAALRALRTSLAADLETCESLRDKASLSQRFMDVLAQIEAAEQAKPEKAGTALDELANRRKAAGRPDATGATRAPRTAHRS